METIAERAATSCYYTIHAGDLGAARMIPQLAVLIQAAIDETVEQIRSGPAADCGIRIVVE